MAAGSYTSAAVHDLYSQPTCEVRGHAEYFNMVLLGEEGPEYELSGNALAATYASTGAALAARQT